MASKIDLHVHTTASDGTLSPRQVVELAKQVGLSTIAITDHDTVSGIPEALAAGAELGVEVIPGIEISTDYRGEDTHVLGYGLDWTSPELKPVLDWTQTARRTRNLRIAQRMRSDGIGVDLEELEARNPGATIGRPHFAQVLVEQGRAESVRDAFDRYLNTGKPYYVPRSYIPFLQAAEIIRRTGGVAVLAHPLQYGYPPEGLRQLVSDGAGAGLLGMEVYYTGYGPEQIGLLLKLARDFGLFATGGSDFHGAIKPDIALGAGHGELHVPESALAHLNGALGRD